MYRTLLTLALIAAAGTAGAQTAQTPPAGTMGPDTRMNTPLNSGAPANGPTGASATPETATAPHMTGAAGTAQKRIEMDGYSNVTGLAKGADGLWHGNAMRGNTSVRVTVDRSGKVSAH